MKTLLRIQQNTDQKELRIWTLYPVKSNLNRQKIRRTQGDINYNPKHSHKKQSLSVSYEYVLKKRQNEKFEGPLGSCFFGNFENLHW